MIHVDSICKHYDRGRIRALDDVSLTVDSGEALALQGPSGAGKSTLLNLIGALDVPTAGDIRIDGVSLNEFRFRHRFRAETIGFVFQFHNLLPHLNARENVELPLYAVNVNRLERRSLASQCLNALGIGELAGRLPGRLSGGERQRVAVARALVNSPRVILADEPTGSLDAVTGDLVIDFLLNYCKNRNAAMIVATHNQSVAEKMRRSIRLEYGRIVCGQ